MMMKVVVTTKRLDALDSDGKWYESVVVGRTGEVVRIHYIGWDSKCDQNITLESDRLAKLYTHTTNWRPTLQPGVEVEVGKHKLYHLRKKGREGGREMIVFFFLLLVSRCLVLYE